MFFFEIFIIFFFCPLVFKKFKHIFNLMKNLQDDAGSFYQKKQLMSELV